MKPILIFLSLLLTGFVLHAQTIITNTERRFTGMNVVVTYTLQTNNPVDVQLSYSADNGATYKPSRSVTGDLQAQSSGNKQIIWNCAEDGVLFAYVIFKVEVDYTQMVFVKGGTFTMGDTWGDGESDENPTHQVTLSNFYIGKYEVTQKQWLDVMGSNPSSFSGCYNCPVEQVSWGDVQTFIRKLNAKTGQNYTLPTEAEWEYAARGGSKTVGYKYSGSNNVDDVAWYYDNAGSRTHNVGAKKANELGIYDMSGNIWEWCNDWHGFYNSGDEINPQGASPGSYRVFRGATSGSYRVFRGGSWGNDVGSVRFSPRYCLTSDYRSDDVGFRLACSSK